MKIKYFVGSDFNKTHLKFIHSILGGTWVYANCLPKTEIIPPIVLEEDGEDVVWFFSHSFYNILPVLKGKKIYVGHGVSFKRYLKEEERINIMNRYFDLILCKGFMEENVYRDAGIDFKKVKRTAYPNFFEIPNIPVEPNSVLFSSTCYDPWDHYDNLYQILRRLDPRIKGYLTIHPMTKQAKIEMLTDACKEKTNIKILKTQEALQEAFAYCQCIVGGSSSVCSPFWFLKKPVIFLKGGKGYNLLKRFGWSEIKKSMPDPLYHKILDESTKIVHWRQFSYELIKKAKIAPSAQKAFYSVNYDRSRAEQQIRDLLNEV